MAQYLYGSAESQVVAREILDENMFKQYEEEAMFFNMFADGSDKFVGDVGAQWVNVVQGNPGMKGMSSSDRAFHRGSTSKRVRSKVTFAQFAITRAFTGQVLHTDMKSLIKGWAPMIKEDMSTFIKQLNIMFAAGDGSGKLANVKAGPARPPTNHVDSPGWGATAPPPRPVKDRNPSALSAVHPADVRRRQRASDGSPDGQARSGPRVPRGQGCRARRDVLGDGADSGT